MLSNRAKRSNTQRRVRSYDNQSAKRQKVEHPAESDRNPSARRQKIEHPVQNVGIYPEMAWNDEMTSFYNDPWGSELNLMNDEPVEWVDLCHSPRIETNCSICGNSGHTAASCSIRTASICEICGYRGHLKNDCPNNWKYYHSTVGNVSPMYAIEDSRRFKFNWDSNDQSDGFYGQFMDAM